MEIDGVCHYFMQPAAKIQDLRPGLRGEVSPQDRYLIVQCGARNVLAEKFLVSLTHFDDFIKEAVEMWPKKALLVCEVPPCTAAVQDIVKRLNNFIRYKCEKLANVHMVEADLRLEEVTENGWRLTPAAVIRMEERIVQKVKDLDLAAQWAW